MRKSGREIALQARGANRRTRPNPIAAMSTTAPAKVSLYQIERGIPIPPKDGRAAKYPWREMAVGDSFTVDKSAKDMNAQRANASRKYGRKFCVRSIDENHCRIWRVE